MTLLAGAGLLVRSSRRWAAFPPALRRAMSSLSMSGQLWRNGRHERPNAKSSTDLESLRACPVLKTPRPRLTLPGVPTQSGGGTQSSGSSGGPRAQNHGRKPFRLSRLFCGLHIPVEAGEFAVRLRGQMSVVVNRSFADTYFSQSAIVGQSLQMPTNASPGDGEVRGIVGDAREKGLNTAPAPPCTGALARPCPARLSGAYP